MVYKYRYLFRWEEKYYPGQLVANDRSGNYMAYSITTANKDNGVVRVTNRKTSDRCDCDSN